MSISPSGNRPLISCIEAAVYAHIAVLAGGAAGDHPFTYLVPPGAAVEVGRCAVVPFGARQELGYILALTETPECPADLCAGLSPPAVLKPIGDVVDLPPVFDRASASLFGWLARTYLCSLPDAVRCVVPSSRLANLRTRVRLAPDAAAIQRRSPVSEAVLSALGRLGGEADLAALQQAVPTARLSDAIRRLAARGAVEVRRTLEIPRDMRTVQGVRLARSRDEAREWITSGRSSKQQVCILERMLELPDEPTSIADLTASARCSSSPVKTLVSAGLLEQVNIQVRRNPWPDVGPSHVLLQLTPDQADSLEVVLPAIRRMAARSVQAGLTCGPDSRETAPDLQGAAQPEVILLWGVTGSGKTEVYIQAIEETRKLGRQSIALVPEISLTAQMVGLFQERFGDRVAILHSRLSDGERLDEWERIRLHQVDVVIGARSALFAPLPALGLIVLDEEHETTYKQQGAPAYVTRDLAVERARLTGACVILASATPCLETAWMAEQGLIQESRLPARIDDRPLPRVCLVDQRTELKENPGHLFSRRLQSAIQQRLGRHEQTILFLNRRGFATVTLCRECGYTAQCPNCAVALTYYASNRTLRCHHCGYAGREPALCPQCKGTKIKQFGIGTERVEHELSTLFPNARISRMDKDSTSRKGATQDLVERFRRGEIDILIGTQMVAKGFNFPGVTLVGVISADTMLNLPDFRAAERTFQLLTQVSGRAGRGDRPGEVIVQTFNTEHYSIQAAAQHDFDAFYQKELPSREAAGYPPYVRLASIVVSSDSESLTAAVAGRVGTALRMASAHSSVAILGPVPAPLSRIKGQFRWHLLLKAANAQDLRDVVSRARPLLAEQDLQHMSVDIDPYSLL